MNNIFKPATTEGTGKNSNVVNGIVIPKKIFYLAIVLAMLYVAVQFAPNFVTQMQTSTTSASDPAPPIKNTQQSGTVIGTPTPSPTQKGQETITDSNYQPKFDPQGNTKYQEITLTNIPAIIPFKNGAIYIKDIKAKEDFLYGNISATRAGYNERISFVFLDSSGYAIEGGIGPYPVSEEKNTYFKIRKAKNAKYLKIIKG